MAYPQPTIQQPPIRDYSDMEDSGTYPEPEQETLRLMIEVDKDLENFEHRVLRGEQIVIDLKKGEKKWAVISPESPKVLNELGVREIMGRLFGIVSRLSKLTYRDDQTIMTDMFFFDMSLSELIAKRAGKWEMDIETAKAVKDACIELVWSVVSSSRLGFTAINIRSSYTRSDVVRSDSQSKESKSFLGIPLGRH